MTTRLRWDDLSFVRSLGEGHAGTVWLATLNGASPARPGGERVAVKRYKPWVLQEPGQHERVFRELAASVKIRHPNVVHNVCLVSDPDGLPALVMKYYDGTSLDADLARRSPDERLPLPAAFRILGGLMDAVTALHEAGIYHRDIKPANILIEGASGSPILMDLGVVSDFLLAEQTQTSAFLGTIRYAAPSYLAGNPYSAAADWHSLGLVAYELFFAKRFLASEEHWARLVLSKLGLKTPSEDDLATSCRVLSNACGQHAAEAAFQTLTTLLTAAPQRLQSLRNAISLEFWNRPFFVQESGDLAVGEPPEVPAFEFDPAGIWMPRHPSPAGGQETLPAAASRLHQVLAECHRYCEDTDENIAGFLKDRYWGWRVRGMDGIYNIKATRLDLYSIYAGGLGDDVTYHNIDINAGLLALYRYGYL